MKKLALLMFTVSAISSISCSFASDPIVTSGDQDPPKKPSSFLSNVANLAESLKKLVVTSKNEELSYEQKAVLLGDKIAAGFVETSMLPGLTSMISKGTSMYASNVLSTKDTEAHNITTGYLLMGKAESLNLDDQTAVYEFLKKKFHERITANVEKNVGGMVGKVISFGGDQAYKYRLKQAIASAFAKPEAKAEVKENEKEKEKKEKN